MCALIIKLVLLLMIIAGVDEAGRGALAGPVVAGAVCFSEPLTAENCPVFGLIKDSKSLTEKQRAAAYEWLTSHVDFGVGISSASVIDEVGIRLANEQAMNQAVQALKQTPEKLMIDGRDKFKFSIQSEDVVKGDEKILEISAASIIAKVSRDRYMVELNQKYPEFKFAENKGYGAKTHYDLLDQGIFCEEHRKTYDPLKTWLNQGRLF